MKLRRVVGLLVVSMAGVHGLFASGFSIMELGARAAGMGGAFVALADDGSALYYNPAGIAFQDGTRFESDAFIVKGKFRFDPSSTPPGTVVPSGGYNGVVSPAIQYLGNMYLTHQLSPNFTAGLGIFAPFGLGDNWTNFKDSDPEQDKFVGRYAGTRGLLQNIWVQPTIAYKIKPNLSVAVGPVIAGMHILLEENILNPLVDGVTFGQNVASELLPGVPAAQAAASIGRLLPDGRARFAGTAIAPGAAAGFLWKHGKTSIGGSYKSAITYHVKGWASFAFGNSTLGPFLSALSAPSFNQLFPSQSIRAELTMPSTSTIGIANSSIHHNLFALDGIFQDYKRFNNIALNFSQINGTATPAELLFHFGFRDTYLIRVGWERHIKENLIVRAGYYFDHSAVPDGSVSPFFPDSSKNVVTAGVSKQIGNKEVTFFYQGAFQLDRVVNVSANANLYTNGSYPVSIQLFGFGLRQNIGGKTIDTHKY
jgi:long-chain fatty acid transport protein